MSIAAVLFDKDGTLFDFRATWDVWAGEVINELAEGDHDRAKALAREMRYNIDNKSFYRDSPVIAGTNREAAECVARGLPGRAVEEIEHFLMIRACDAPLSEAVPLAAYLDRLRVRGLKLGVVTNDTETGARAHLNTANVTQHFDFIAGFDSGFGIKPAPEPLLAFAKAVAVAPENVVMVGDSTHDLIAGRRAGMYTLGVLTGPADAQELSPFADAVLPDIGHIPDWLDRAEPR